MSNLLFNKKFDCKKKSKTGRERVMWYISSYTLQFFLLSQIKDKHCIVLEYVSPGPIRKYLQNGAVTELIVRSFTRQILTGLEFLHANNIMHRYYETLSCCIYILRVSVYTMRRIFFFIGSMQGCQRRQCACRWNRHCEAGWFWTGKACKILKVPFLKHFKKNFKQNIYHLLLVIPPFYNFF